MEFTVTPDLGGGKPAWFAFLLVAFLAGCDQDRCLLHSDCPSGEVCTDGACRVACSVSEDCPLESYCESGACVSLAPGQERPCESDDGCPEASDATTDDAGPLADAVVTPDASVVTPDAASLDAVAGDAATVDGGDAAESDAVSDGGVEPDGPEMDGFVPPDVLPPVIDLSGVYAVRHEVRLTGSRDYAVGDVFHTIVTLHFVGGSAYRMEVRDQQGGQLFVEDALDFTSPEPGRYQFEYTRDGDAPPDGCVQRDVRFQRGTVDDVGPYVLAGTEDLNVEFEGEACAASDATVQFDVEWNPVPN